MTKRQFLNSCWIHYGTRLPPDDLDDRVIVWNTKVDGPWILISSIARQNLLQKLEDPEWPNNSNNIALYYEWWMPAPLSPQGDRE